MSRITDRPRSLNGLTIAVTGSTSGIGYFIAEGFARLGADLIVTARSENKARAVLAMLPGPGTHTAVSLDLADISSIRAAGATLGAGNRLDALVMNAGVINASPTYTHGPFGVESTVDVNVMAHMELLRLTLPALRRAPAARIVSTGSMLTRKIPFDHDNWLAEKSYSPRVAYAMSRHAAEILGFELDRRLNHVNSTITSVVTHPGGAIGALTPDRSDIHQRSWPTRLAARLLAPLVATVVQGKDDAALPAIAAITAQKLPRGTYVGPQYTAAGMPFFDEPVPSSRDPELGTNLWTQTERTLGHGILAALGTTP